VTVLWVFLIGNSVAEDFQHSRSVPGVRIARAPGIAFGELPLRSAARFVFLLGRRWLLRQGWLWFLVRQGWLGFGGFDAFGFPGHLSIS
jgi:hypothetical protein